MFSSTDEGRELNITQVCRGCQSHCENNLDYGTPFITGNIETHEFTNDWDRKWANNPRKILLFPSKIQNIEHKLIKKTIDIIINHYGIKQLIIKECFIDVISSHLNNNHKNKIIFINTIESIIEKSIDTEEIFFNIPTLSILCPWDQITKIPLSLVSRFNNLNIILAPDHIRAFNSYKTLKIIDPEISTIDEFINLEII